jgi:hypothetical protein
MPIADAVARLAQVADSFRTASDMTGGESDTAFSEVHTMACVVPSMTAATTATGAGCRE